MLSDIEIARKVRLEPIEKVAEKAGIPSNYLEKYGEF